MKKISSFIIKWIGSTKLLATLRFYMGRSLVRYYASKGKIICNLASFRNQEDNSGIDLIKQIKGETEMLLSDQEAYLIYKIVKKVEKIEGDIAEVGVYKGGSAKLMRAATGKPVHLFDTFEGLPELCEKDNPKQFQKGRYASSFGIVKNYLNQYSEVYFYPGIFPSTAEPVKDKKFSFVHIDVDIYESTLNCLKFFYPRMSSGGVIISHDYPGSDGARRAIDEFLKYKPEIAIQPFATRQALIVKV